MKDLYIWYKNKVGGPFLEEGLDAWVKEFVNLVDKGALAKVPDTIPLAQNMKDSPDIPHIFYHKKVEQ